MCSAHEHLPPRQSIKLQKMQEGTAYVYLYIVGTWPECQTRGLGSALMKHVNAVADR